MKKILLATFLTLTLMMSFAVPSMAAATTDSTSISSWSILSDHADGKTATAAVVGTSSYGTVTGTGALQICVSATYSNTYVYVYQDVGVTKGNRYRLTGNMRSWRTDDSASLLYTTTNTAANRIANLKTVAGGSDQRDFSYDFTWNSDNKRLTFALTGSGNMLIDNLSLKQINDAGDGSVTLGSEILKNGDFETVPEKPLTESKNYLLEGVAGWGHSNWNIPAGQMASTTGIEVKNNFTSTPEGSNLLYIHAGGATNTANLNANAIQQVSGLSTSKTYHFTGKVLFYSNNTYFSLTNCTYSYGSVSGATGQHSLEDMFGGQNSRGKWQTFDMTIQPTNAVIEFRVTAAANRYIYIDDFSLTETGGRKELMVNGGFEGTPAPEYKVEANYNFYPAGGDAIIDETPLTSLSAVSGYFTDSICARASVLNDIYDTMHVNAYLAVYKNENGALKLADVVVKSADIDYSNSTQNIDIYYTLPEDMATSEYSCKMFVFDDNMTPYGSCSYIAE